MIRVLIVDDQSSFRATLRQLLAHAGLTVVGEAGDIVEAETQVKALTPDLAVIDVMLPGINGLEGTQLLKKRWPSLRVILISAYADQYDILARAALEVGAETFIAKEDLELQVVQAW